MSIVAEDTVYALSGAAGIGVGVFAVLAVIALTFLVLRLPGRSVGPQPAAPPATKAAATTLGAAAGAARDGAAPDQQPHAASAQPADRCDASSTTQHVDVPSQDGDPT